MSISRDTFDKLKHYVGVRLQQGVPLVDADWNEQEDIRRYELQAFLKWFVGNGVPEGNDGFCIVSIVNKIILTSKKNDTGVSSIEVLRKSSSAASKLGFGPGNNLASRAAPPAAQLTGEVAGDFKFEEEGLTLVVSADGMEEETVTFQKGNFTAAQVAEAIEDAMSNLTASAGTGNDFNIKGGDGTAKGAGRCLVEGGDVINESNLKYSAQRLYKNGDLAAEWGVDSLKELVPPEVKKRIDLVYLDVWEREVHADEDGDLVNSAIGIETCVRLKREWVVRVAESAKVDELPTSSDGHVYYPLASLTRLSSDPAIRRNNITDLRSTNVHLASAPSTTGVVVFPDSTDSVQNISDLIDPGLGPGAISVRLGLEYIAKEVFVGHSKASAIFGLDHDVLLGALIEPQSGMFRVGIWVPNLETLPIRVRWWAFKPRQDIGEVSGIFATGSIVGYVKNIEEELLSGATVSVGDISCLTELGKYVLREVPVGPQTVKAEHEDYAPLSKEVMVEAGETTLVDFVLLLATGSIAGYVKNIEEELLSGATVSVGDISCLTELGKYVLREVPVGPQTVKAEHEDYAPLSKEVMVEAGETTLVDFVLLLATGSIAGFVKNVAGEPLEGATVSAGGISKVTGENGFYCLEGLPEGSYNVKAACPGYNSGEITVFLTPGQQTKKDFVLTPGLCPRPF